MKSMLSKIKSFILREGDMSCEKPCSQETNDVQTDDLTENNSISKDEAYENIGDDLVALFPLLKEIKKNLEEKEYLLKMNAEMHDELTKLRNDFIEDIKRPYIKGYLQIYDRLDDLFKANTDSSFPELANAMNTINNIKLNLLDILEEFDIEVIEPEINSTFNPKEHRALKTVLTDEQKKDKTIAAVKSPGFYDKKNNRCFRTSNVEVFKFQS